MKTRMEKYYRSNSDNNRRSVRNTDLYRTIYDMGEYSNVEGIININKTDEIDIAKIKDLLKRVEDENAVKRHQIVREVEPNQGRCEDMKSEQKNYDIREVLNQARESRPQVEKEHRSLDSTQYNILKKIKLDMDEKGKDYFANEEGLLELIHTITNTSMLNKLGDKELSLDLLSSLKSSGKTTVYEQGLDCENEQNNNLKESIDRSFFTSSMNFQEEDFEQLKDINNSLKKNNFLIKFLSFVLFATIIFVMLYVVYTFFKP